MNTNYTKFIIYDHDEVLEIVTKIQTLIQFGPYSDQSHVQINWNSFQHDISNIIERFILKIQNSKINQEMNDFHDFHLFKSIKTLNVLHDYTMKVTHLAALIKQTWERTRSENQAPGSNC